MKLFVGNLAYKTTNESLAAHFGQAGTVTSATVVVDRTDGRSKGFGFVEMSTAAEAERARQELDKSDLDGRTINVDVANQREERGGRGGGGPGRGGYRAR